MDKIFLAFILMLPAVPTQGPTDPWPTPEEFHWLAKAVVGEVSVMGLDLREEAGSWVIHTAYNRRAHDWFPDDLLTVIRQGYNGAHVWKDDLPPGWAYAVVNDTLRRRVHLGEDPTGGSLFLFGGQDLIDCMDRSQHRGSLYRPGWVFSVHLFHRWPYPAGCWYD